MRASSLIVLLVLMSRLGGPSFGAEAKKPTEKEDPAHEELRALRRELVDAVNTNDVKAILAHCDPEIVLTAQHGEVTRGHDALKKYLEKMVTGPNRLLKSYSVEPTVDALSILHGGDTAIAYGSSKDRFVLADGTEFSLDSRWTATLVKKNGKWLVASLHSSANVLDNAILRKATGWIWKAAAISGVVGMLLGLLIMAALKRSKPTAAPAADT
jgi:uncharacterized protein (TIGR02246 family)